MPSVDEKEYSTDKIYSWIMGMINVYRPEYREDFVPIWDMIRETIKKDKSCLKSTITLDDTVYEFNMSLKKR